MNDAPRTVAYGTIITSATSAVVTGIYCAFKGKSGFLAASAALNGGITAATFFSIREYVVSPMLASTSTSTRSKAALGTAIRPTWSELRLQKLLDSGISGGAAGGLLNGWRRGMRGILPGITTGSLACAFLQLAYNEARITRIKYIRLQTITSLERSSQISDPPRPLKAKALALLGLHKLSDEEYLKKLKSSRDKYLRQIEKLEQEREKDSQSTSRDE